MIKDAIGTGATIEEAKENALLLLDAKIDDDVQFEVISTAKKKTLGLFGGADAKVRAYIELPDPKPAKKTQADKPKKAEKPAKEEKAEKAEKPVKAQKAEKPAKKDTTVTKSSEKAVDPAALEDGSSAKKAVNYLENILAALGCENIAIMVEPEDNGAIIDVSGDGLGALIGRRGETLSAVSYLTSLAANSGNGYYRVTINIGDYRQRREQTLISLAKRMSAQAIKSGRKRTLDPMNPYERRIIHTAVQEIDGVESNSIGEGSARRVVITPTKKAEASAVAREQRKDAGNIPLYGKIK
ncbi:MAG: Jag N-terminal domain-containing protein [Clostridia bacterium]|nr:Jag N-terminal domain-containing protein [Clostridia bacterium]